MWNMKKTGKKIAVFMMAVSLTVSLVSPFSVLADDQTEEGKTVVEEQKELAIDAEGKENEQLVPDLKNECEEKEVKKQTSESSPMHTDVDAMAMADKVTGEFSYSYLDKNNVWQTEYKTVLLDKDATFDEIVKLAKDYRVEDEIPGVTFDHWEMTYNDITEPLGDIVRADFEAVYNKTKIITIWRYYFNEEGERVSKNETKVVKEGTTYAQVIKEAIGQELPKMYEGLQFEKWIFDEEDMKDEVIEDNYGEIWLDAQYKNCMVSYWVIESEQDLEELLFEQNRDVIKERIHGVTDFGTKVNLLTEVGDYAIQKYYILERGADGPGFEEVLNSTYDIEDHTDFVVVGMKKAKPETPERPEEPEKPETPEKPEIPEKPEEPEKPEMPEKPQNSTVELPQEIVDKQIDRLNRGENVYIQMGRATIIPKEMLEAAKGKDVVIKLDMGNYTWTIDGNDIREDMLKDINLEVKVNAKVIPNKALQALAGNNPTCQLSLTHNGTFGFKAELAVNVGSEYSGKYGNLYYYGNDGKMVYRNTGKVDRNGNVTLIFDHASDYVIVLSNQQMTQDDVPPALQPQSSDRNENETIKTGDSAPIFVLTILAIISASLAVLLFKRKIVK